MLPFAAALSGDPFKSLVQTQDATLDQAGQAALGRGIQQMFQPQIPGAVPMAPQGAQPGGGQSQQTQAGGAPMASPSGAGVPQQTAFPGAQQMAPPPQPRQPVPQGPPPQLGGGMGPQQAISSMSFPQLLQAIVRANPGASPEVIGHALKAAQPFMNMLTLNDYRNAMLGMKQEGFNLQARGQDMRYGAQMGNQDIRLQALEQSQYWESVKNGLIDPTNPQTPPPTFRGRAGPQSQGPAPPQPSQAGAPPPQAAPQAGAPPPPQAGASTPLPATPVQTVPVGPAAQTQPAPTNPMVAARQRLQERLFLDPTGKSAASDAAAGAAGGGVTAGLEATPPAPQAAAAPQQAAAPQKTAQAETSMAPIDRLAKGIKDGSIPPDMSKIPAKQRGILIPKLQKEGVDLSRAELEWKQAQRDVNAMNTSQQVALVGAAKAGLETMKRVRELSHKLGMGGLKPWNNVQLETAIQTGNTDAVAYDTALRVLKEDLGKVSTGGYAPTESVWKLVNRQYDPTYGEKQLNAALDETERFINNRIKSIDIGGTGLGPTTPGRYLQPPGGAAPQSAAPQSGASGFDVQGALKAGYTQQQIDEYLAKRRKQ